MRLNTLLRASGWRKSRLVVCGVTRNTPRMKTFVSDGCVQRHKCVIYHTSQPVSHQHTCEPINGRIPDSFSSLPATKSTTAGGISSCPGVTFSAHCLCKFAVCTQPASEPCPSLQPRTHATHFLSVRAQMHSRRRVPTMAASSGSQSAVGNLPSSPPSSSSSSSSPTTSAPYGFSFSAGGLLFSYYIGIAAGLRDAGVLLPETPVAGASAGSLIAACCKSGLSTDTIVAAFDDLALDCR